MHSRRLWYKADVSDPHHTRHWSTTDVTIQNDELSTSSGILERRFQKTAHMTNLLTSYFFDFRTNSNCLKNWNKQVNIKRNLFSMIYLTFRVERYSVKKVGLHFQTMVNSWFYRGKNPFFSRLKKTRNLRTTAIQRNDSDPVNTGDTRNPGIPPWNSGILRCLVSTWVRERLIYNCLPLWPTSGKPGRQNEPETELRFLPHLTSFWTNFSIVHGEKRSYLTARLNLTELKLLFEKKIFWGARVFST